MVETALGTLLMADPGSPHRPATTGRPAARCAVGMAAITRGADGEQAAAVSAGLLAKRLVHGVGARGASSDWTTSRNRGTTAPTGSVCRSSGRSRGSGRTRALTPRLSPLQPYPNAPVPCEHRRRRDSVRSATGADDEPSSVRRQLLWPLVLPHLRMLPAILRMIVPAVSDESRAGGTDGRRSGRPEVHPGPEARRGAWRAPGPESGSPPRLVNRRRRPGCRGSRRASRP